MKFKDKSDDISLFYPEVIELQYFEDHEVVEEEEDNTKCICQVKIFFFILILCILGLTSALLAFGIIGLNIDFSDFMWDASIIIYVSICLCVLGALGILVSLFGCVVSFIDKKCPLITYLCFTSVLNFVYVLLLIAFIIAFVSNDYISTELAISWSDSQADYQEGSDSEITQKWDRTQLKYKCCGVNSHLDWQSYNPNYVPDSCCIHDAEGKSNIGCAILTPLNADHYENGCFPKIFNELKTKAIIVASVLLASIICMISSITLGTIKCGMLV